MSDLRERLLAVAEQTDMYALKEIHWSGYVEALWPSIEGELQKEQREIARWIRNCQVLIEETNAAHQETLSWKARAEQNYAEWEEANKKIERLEEDVKQYRAMAEAAERERWVDANDYAILKQRVYKLLDQTIEVLEEAGGVIWQHRPELWAEEAKPLLDNLKALKREPDVHQQAVAEMLAPKPIDHVDGGFKP